MDQRDTVTRHSQGVAWLHHLGTRPADVVRCSRAPCWGQTKQLYYYCLTVFCDVASLVKIPCLVTFHSSVFAIWELAIPYHLRLFEYRGVA
jgi:hypothetical protein